MNTLIFCINHRYLALLGDFNARTSNENDFIYENEIDDEELIVQILGNSYMDVFRKYDILEQRNSKDTRKNNFGNQLLQLCKYNDLLICNGRTGDDKNVGNFTCKNSSVVDYVICSTSLFERIVNFDVLEFSNLFSDAHCGLSLTLSCNVVANICENTGDDTTCEKNQELG